MTNHTKIVFCFILVLFISYFTSANSSVDQFEDTLGHIKPTTSNEDQSKAAQDLIERILGKKAKRFLVIVNPKIGPKGRDTFTVTRIRERRVQITGTSGVAVAWGFYYYIKTYCNCHISWEGKQVQLPQVLPDVDETITSNDRFRYYQNVCTAGYSSTWWDWDQWEKNIDWMALNGINLALAFHAQEAIWERVYLELNLTRGEIDEHFSGPAFLPWQRMGNIRGWGSPLPESWHNFTIELQHKILNRMRELGIIPVLPAFAGHVPRAFSRLYPDRNLTEINPWNGFNDEYCCPYLLSPQDPLFKSIGRMFLEAYINEFGTDHVYNCDTFNENEPMDSDLNTLANIGQAIYSAMTDVDPQAIWILQGWLFVNEIEFWTKDRVKAFITSVPIGKMIILDLQSEQFPQYNRLNSYYGQPYIWCMLHNFGGTLGMFGSATVINERVFEARNMNGSTMIGTGLTPEGINQNYVIYELMNEMAYRKKPTNLDLWFENYAARRYGAWNEYATEAWIFLKKSVYNFVGIQRIRGHYAITRRPNLHIKTYTWYEPYLLFHAWDNLIRARYGRGYKILYKHDLIDVTRQSLQLIGEYLYTTVRRAYNKNNLTDFRIQSGLFLDVFTDLEVILESSENFLLGKWIRDARLLGTNDDEKNLYEYNARNQITLWGPEGEIQDYANKQWSGVMMDYFRARWLYYINALEDSLINNTPLNQTAVDHQIFEMVEKAFTYSDKEYPYNPIGNPIRIALYLNKKWHKLLLLEKMVVKKKAMQYT